MSVLWLCAGLALAQGPEPAPEALPRAPLRYRPLRVFQLTSMGTLAVGTGFFTWGVTQAAQVSGSASLQYLGVGAVGGGVAVVGLGLGWLSTAMGARRLRRDGALSRRWAVRGSVLTGVLAVGLGATRNTLPWTDQGQIWVNQGFTASILATVGLLGTQFVLNELAWWDHGSAIVTLTPWGTPERAGLTASLRL